MIYTADGTAKFGLPAGDYTIHAGRGFEYGIDTVRVSLKPGESVRKELVIRREVPTPGFVACDTHVHTLTHSGHGDSTDVERRHHRRRRGARTARSPPTTTCRSITTRRR